MREGDAITVHYDPMLAKLVVWDDTRDAAVRRLRLALAEYEVVGLQTNLPLLRRIAAHPEFAAGAVDTGFIPRHEHTLLAPPGPTPPAALAAAAAHLLRQSPAPTPGDPHSPWSLPGAWRLGTPGHTTIVLRDATSDHTVRATGTRLDHPEATLTATGLLIGGRHLTPTVVPHGDQLTVLLDGNAWPLTHLDPLAPPADSAAATDRITAPMPGRVVSVAVTPGQEVTRGEVLLVLEAMKVQMRITAPKDGAIDAIHAAPGTTVDEGTELVTYRT